jgi:hypothetical protein
VNRPLALTLLALLSGCTGVQSSALPTRPGLAPSSAPVVVFTTRDPPGAEEVAIVEAHGRRPVATLEALLAEFQGRVAAVGGDRARVDGFATRYEMVTESYTYECGTTEHRTETRTVSRPGPNGTSTMSTESVTVPHHVSKTCTGTRTVEAAVLTLTGRAFRARGTP